jgi:hypothetical protein
MPVITASMTTEQPIYAQSRVVVIAVKGDGRRLTDRDLVRNCYSRTLMRSWSALIRRTCSISVAVLEMLLLLYRRQERPSPTLGELHDDGTAQNLT